MVVKWANGAKEVIMPWELNGIEVCYIFIILLFKYIVFTTHMHEIHEHYANNTNLRACIW